MATVTDEVPPPGSGYPTGTYPATGSFGYVVPEYAEDNPPAPPTPPAGTAGTPGTWTGTAPVDAADAATVGATATPTTAWATGEYVVGSAGSPTGDMHWNGTAWVAGITP